MNLVMSSMVKNMVQTVSRACRAGFGVMRYLTLVSPSHPPLVTLSFTRFNSGFSCGKVSRQKPEIDTTTNNREMTPYT